ncbi:hypothetical protein ABKN59_008466 [Abortiporus biennis]
MPKDTGEMFEEIFRNAWVRFTHFTKGGGDHVLTQNAIAPAFARCMAWICCDGEQAVDIVIPIFRGEHIRPETMTAILIQVKRRTGSGQYVIDAEKTLKFFTAPDSGRKMAYITLVMDLGVQPSSQSQAQGPAMDTTRKLKMALTKGTHTSLDSGTLNGTNKRNYREPHPPYSIHATGCSDKVYAVLSYYDQTSLANLLRFDQSDSSEHPREEGLIYVEKQKPFFAAGKRSHHWLNCELLDTSPRAVDGTPPQMQEGVAVGREAYGEDEFN